ncbi:MAG: hypothetical protein RL469_1823 [Pseudomonadota bacterium]
MTHRFRKTALVAVGVLSAFSAVQAAAQDVPLEEIVITARQREEKLVDVPATVQAFTASEIKNAGIERPQDFIAMTPGVAQVQTAEAGDMQVVIRGINTGRDAETNFALVIDGVLQTNPNALNQELANVSQIEVLKGPQGALYGRNAVAGAMIISTRKPTDKLELDLGGGYGQFKSYKANLFVSGPITDETKGSFGVYTRSTDGEWTNSLLKCDDCVDFFKETGVTGRVITNVGDGGTVDIKAKYSKINAGAINFNASLALAEAAAYLKSLGVPNAADYYEDPNKHTFVYINNVKPQNEQKNINLSVKGEFDVAVGKLTAIAAFNDQKNYFLTDGTSAAFYLYSLTSSCQKSNDAKPANPLPSPFGPYQPSGGFVQTFFPPYGPSLCDGYQYQQRDQKDSSLELRVSSPGDQALRWTAGTYFADISRRVVVSQGSDSGQGFLAQALVLTGGPNPTDLLYDDDFKSKVYAAFGQLAYDVQPGLEVAAALRYDSEDRAVSNNVPKIKPQTIGFNGSNGANTFINPAYTVNPSLTSIPGRSKTFSQLQPKLSVNWKQSDELAWFASYGYGFRSGGFNSTGSKATVELNYAALCLGASRFVAPYVPVCPGGGRSISNVNDDYKKEVSKAFEAGFKAKFLEGALSLDGAVYQTKIDDMQFFNFFAGPFGLLRVVTNAEEAESKGFELDSRYRVNDMFTVFAGYGYSDTKINKYLGRPYTSGNAIPYAPKYTGNAGIDFKAPLQGEWTVNARLDASFVGETWFSTVQENLVPNLFTYFGFGQGNFSKQKRDPYQLMNARIGISNGTFGVTAWGHNIADKKYLQEIIPAPEFGGSFIHDSPGRSFGVDFNYSFR